MQIKLNTMLLNIDETPMLEAPGKPLLLRSVLINSLVMDERGDGKVKFDKYQLAMKIKGAGETVDIPVEDIVTIKDAVGKAYLPMIVGQVFPLLDKTADKTEAKPKK